MIEAILDIDFAYWTDSHQENWLSIKYILQNNPDKITICERPSEALLYLDAEEVFGALYIRIGLDAPLHINTNLEDLPLGIRAGVVTDDNYLAFSLRDGCIGQLHSVLPKRFDKGKIWDDIKDNLGRFASAVTITGYDDIGFLIETMTFSRIFCSLTEEQVPSNILSDLQDTTQEAGGLKILARELEEVARKRLTSLHTRGFPLYYDLIRDPVKCNSLLYHASDQQNLKRLTPGDQGFLFLSQSPRFAACFALRPNNQDGWVQGVDYISDIEPFIYLIVPARFRPQIHRSASLYRVRSQDLAQVEAFGTVKDYEFIVRQPIDQFEEIHIPDVAAYLESHRVRLAYDDNIDILDEILLYNAEPYRQEIEQYFSAPFSALIALKTMAPFIYYFLVTHKKIPPSTFNPCYKSIYKKILYKIILPKCFLHGYINHNGYHGMDHCASVAGYAAFFSLSLDLDPMPMIIAAVIHDLFRENDNEDHVHCRVGAEAAKSFLLDKLEEYYNVADTDDIVDAILRHAENEPSANMVLNCLRDADRQRLSWERGFQPKFFFTKLGKLCAERGANYLANRFHLSFPDPLTEIKTEITELCNLSCQFCHQSFGHHRNAQSLDLEEFQEILSRAEQSGIDTIRVTGGEPSTHTHLKQILSSASKRGFNVILNTNASGKDTDYYVSLMEYVDLFKISLPYVDENGAISVGHSRKVYKKKLETISELYVSGANCELLTIMLPMNVDRFWSFIEFITPLTSIKWQPLRPESTADNTKPISHDKMNELATMLKAAQSLESRWIDLKLGLATPFCVLKNPVIAPSVFTGRIHCGPMASLSVSPEMSIMSCYSEREPLQFYNSYACTANLAFHADPGNLPLVCQECVFGSVCLGGCVSGKALIDTKYGRIDYLADPRNLRSILY